MNLGTLSKLLIVTTTSLAISCGEDKGSSECLECRQQNAPLNDALVLEPSLRNTSNLEAAPISSVDPANVNTNAGIAPSSLGNASNMESSDAINEATRKLIANQQTEF